MSERFRSHAFGCLSIQQNACIRAQIDSTVTLDVRAKLFFS